MKAGKRITKLLPIKITDQPVKGCQGNANPASLLGARQHSPAFMREITLPAPEDSLAITVKEAFLSGQHRDSYLQILLSLSPFCWQDDW